MQDALPFDAVGEMVLDLVLKHGRHHGPEEGEGVIGSLQQRRNVDH